MTENAEREFARKLVRLREQRGWLQKEAVEAINRAADANGVKGISQRQYVRWEAAGTPPGQVPSPVKLRLIAQAFSVHISELTGGEAPVDGLADILGQLDEIRKTLEAHVREVQGMYDRALQRDTEIAAKLGQIHERRFRIERLEAKLDLIITKSGLVEDADERLVDAIAQAAEPRTQLYEEAANALKEREDRAAQQPPGDRSRSGSSARDATPRAPAQKRAARGRKRST